MSCISSHIRLSSFMGFVVVNLDDAFIPSHIILNICE